MTSTTIHIAAVGDLLMWNSQIQAAKIAGKNQYDFYRLFHHVAPYLQAADLTIGNLETTFSGSQTAFVRKNPKTGFPMFTCPDELAPALKQAGFDVVTTANNHCLDGGVRGLMRTLSVLDRYGIRHTGTFASKADSEKDLILNIKGIDVGILAYTYGTNGFPVPAGQPWIVNRIEKSRIAQDIRQLKPKADLLIVCLHFGREFRRTPNEGQKNLVQLCFQEGADLVLGAHPHVLQPMDMRTIADRSGQRKKRLVIYSLGNFISKTMWKNLHTVSGVILNVAVRKDLDGRTEIQDVSYIPTWVHRSKVLAIRKALQGSRAGLSQKDQNTLRQVWRNTTALLKGNLR